MSMSIAPILAGATHYYQYDLAIGSTPQECVDIFSLGASASNPPVMHTVFAIDIAMDVARGNMANSKHWVARQTGGLAGPTIYNRDIWDIEEERTLKMSMSTKMTQAANPCHGFRWPQTIIIISMGALRQLASRHSPLCLLPDHIIPCSGTFYGLP
jgi:hypothetical protein